MKRTIAPFLIDEIESVTPSWDERFQPRLNLVPKLTAEPDDEDEDFPDNRPRRKQFSDLTKTIEAAMGEAKESVLADLARALGVEISHIYHYAMKLVADKRATRRMRADGRWVYSLVKE